MVVGGDVWMVMEEILEQQTLQENFCLEPKLCLVLLVLGAWPKLLSSAPPVLAGPSDDGQACHKGMQLRSMSRSNTRTTLDSTNVRSDIPTNRWLTG